MKYFSFFAISVLVCLFKAERIYAFEYVAFSLKEAQKIIISTSKNEDYRNSHPDVFTLGGIKAIRGLVYDRKNKDVILVGEINPERSILTLDDFAVALRARFIYGKWPLVSIDPTEETKRTQMQTVRFEGGIEDTQFGQDLFDADNELKKLNFGLLPQDIPGFKSGWDLLLEWLKQSSTKKNHISSRHWFYPVFPHVPAREDVASIKGLKVAVFTQVLSAEIDGKKIEDLSTFQFPPGDTFAKMVSDNFEKLALIHPSFARVQGLEEMVALTKAIEAMEAKPDFSFWLKDYKVKEVITKKKLEVLKRKEKHENFFHQISGGVQLMAIALRLKAGDVTALKEAVLKTRPSLNTLSWRFVVGEWLIPTSPGMLKVEDLTPLFAQAMFLQTNKRYDDALTLYAKIMELKPDWDWVYNNRGLLFKYKGNIGQALDNFNKALEINPKSFEAYNNRGVWYYDRGEYSHAIADFDMALKINPTLFEAYSNRGGSYSAIGKHKEALADFKKALSLNPKSAELYHNLSCVYKDKGQYDDAISFFSKAIQINQNYLKPYNDRGCIYFEKHDYDKALADFEMALKINPTCDRAYVNRGGVYNVQGKYEQAFADLNKALEINPSLAEAYNNRGEVYVNISDYDRALADFNKAIEINQNYNLAYSNRGIVYGKKGEHDKALRDLNKVLELNPRSDNAYYNRGLCYLKKGDYDRALADFNKAIEINPRFTEAYANRGATFDFMGEYIKAIIDYDKALKIDPNYVESYFNKALSCEKAGRQREAINLYKKFLRYASQELVSHIEMANKRIREWENYNKYQAYCENKTQKEYYPNGVLKLVGNCKDGKPEGIGREYYENGNIKEEVTFKDGKMEGIAKKYYENGNIMEEANFKNNKKVGKYKKYYKNGNVKEEVNFKDEGL